MEKGTEKESTEIFPRDREVFWL